MGGGKQKEIFLDFYYFWKGDGGVADPFFALSHPSPIHGYVSTFFFLFL